MSKKVITIFSLISFTSLQSAYSFQIELIHQMQPENLDAGYVQPALSISGDGNWFLVRNYVTETYDFGKTDTGEITNKIVIYSFEKANLNYDGTIYSERKGREIKTYDSRTGRELTTRKTNDEDFFDNYLMDPNGKGFYGGRKIFDKATYLSFSSDALDRDYGIWHYYNEFHQEYNDWMDKEITASSDGQLLGVAYRNHSFSKYDNHGAVFEVLTGQQIFETPTYGINSVIGINVSKDYFALNTKASPIEDEVLIWSLKAASKSAPQTAIKIDDHVRKILISPNQKFVLILSTNYLWIADLNTGQVAHKIKLLYGINDLAVVKLPDPKAFDFVYYDESEQLYRYRVRD